MRKIDAISVVVAALIGAVALLLLVGLFDSSNQRSGLYALLGAVTGSVVQIGLRVSDVS